MSYYSSDSYSEDYSEGTDNEGTNSDGRDSDGSDNEGTDNNATNSWNHDNKDTQSDSDTDSDTNSDSDSDVNLSQLVSQLNMQCAANETEKHPIGMTIPQICSYHPVKNNAEGEITEKITCQLCQKVSVDKKSFYTHVLSHKVSDFMKK